MYEYLTGPLFRGRVSAIVEACVTMQEDLEAEKRAFTRAWAKRQRRLEMLMTGTAGMYGDFQGIVGRSMPELEGLQVPQLATAWAWTRQSGAQAWTRGTGRRKNPARPTHGRGGAREGATPEPIGGRRKHIQQDEERGRRYDESYQY